MIGGLGGGEVRGKGLAVELEGERRVRWDGGFLKLGFMKGKKTD